MKPSAMAAALLMCCSALSACGTTRALVPLKPPLEKMACKATTAAERPKIPPEYAIDWSKVTSVAQARAEHDAYVRSIRTREGLVAGYIVQIEGVNFVCSSNAAWLRDFYAALPS